MADTPEKSELSEAAKPTAEAAAETVAETAADKSAKPADPKPKLWVTLGVWVLRIAVGALFIFSGTVKDIDLWGFVFKLEDYLAAWNMTQPRSLLLILAMGISGYELVFGFLLATGCYKRVAPWALTLSMAVMLPLTAYIAIANPVSDCGCFGDFLILSNTATFIKNLFITAALILLIIYNPRVKQGLYRPAIQWLVVVIVSLYAIVVGLYGWNIQPMLDFRSFAPGTMIAPEDAGDEEDEPLPTFIYEKGGRQQEFTADSLPGDDWTFVRRVDAPSTAKPSAITVYDGDEDITASTIEPEGEQLLLIIPESRRADISYTYYLNELNEKADSAGIPMVALLGASPRGIEFWKDISMASYPCYSVEDTQLKEFSRGVMSLVLLRDGCVVSKSTLASLIGSDNDALNPMGAVRSLENIDHSSEFRWITGFYAILLLLIYLFQGMLLGLRMLLKHALRKMGKVSKQ
ncbi:MAG: BT_3928 family protein [Muribaculaceae bacterium]